MKDLVRKLKLGKPLCLLVLFSFLLIALAYTIIFVRGEYIARSLEFVGHENYLPIILNQKKIILPYKLGAQIEGGVAGKEQWLVDERFYQIPCKWRDVEGVQGIYDWSAYDNDFALLDGYPIVVGVKLVPEWARAWPEYIASPPSPEFYDNYAYFILELVNRYDNVVAVELFNEPNADRDEAKIFEEHLGAWIMNGDVEEGGHLYAEMVTTVWNIVKIDRPEIRIFAGALMDNQFASPFLEAMFDQGIIADAISFHAYPRYYLGNFYKIRDLVVQYRDITAYPFVVTETSLLSTIDTPEFRKAQADYLDTVLEDWNEFGVESVGWYTLANNVWMWSNLVEHSIEQPSYDIFSRPIQEEDMVLGGDE